MSKDANHEAGEPLPKEVGQGWHKVGCLELYIEPDGIRGLRISDFNVVDFDELVMHVDERDGLEEMKTAIEEYENND